MSEPLTPPVTPEPLNQEQQITALLKEVTAMREALTESRQQIVNLQGILGTLLLRRNNSQIILIKDQKAYLDQLEVHGRPPLFDIKPYGKDGALKVTADWSTPPYSELS